MSHSIEPQISMLDNGDRAFYGLTTSESTDATDRCHRQETNMQRLAITFVIFSLALFAGPIACGEDDESPGINHSENNDQPNNDQLNNDQLNNDQPNNDQPNNDQPNNDQPNNDQPNNDQPNNDQPNNDQPNNDQPNNDQPNNDQPNNDQPNNDQPNNDQPNNNEEPEFGEPQGAIDFIVSNEADDSIYIQSSTVDIAGPGAWVTLRHEGEDLVLSPNCLPAYCDDPDDTPDCEELEAAVEEVPPGTFTTFVWDGYHYVVDESGDEACTEAVDAYEDEIWAELCYGQHVDDEAPDGPLVETPNCPNTGDDLMTPSTVGQFILTIESE